MQTIFQVLTKPYLLLFGQFIMFSDICMQIHFVVFALKIQIKYKLTSKNYAKTSNPLCAGNEFLVK